jgi:uncharacterized surface protein with fasciclin (FAS1) repeats
MKRLFLQLAAASVAGALISACGGNDSGDDQTPGTMLDVATRGGLSAVVLAATNAGLADGLRAPNTNLTLLAPTNDAFGLLANQLGYRTVDELIKALPAATLKSILEYHVLPARLSRADLLAGGASQNTSLTQGGVVLPLALNTANGIKITDSVGRVGIVGLTDVPNDNGVLHVIDRVLLPPGLLTVLQTVQSNPERFSSLVGAASAPALVTALNGAGPFTLFAPVDEAFKAADVAALLPTLGVNQIDVLLKYHVLGATVLAKDIPFGTAVATLATPQTITINAGTPPVIATITDTTATPAKITVVDIIASNGVVHVIDKVLLPALPAPAP